MSAVATSSLKRDLGLIAWQVRYEQRAYWRNRGRGIFTFVFPLMFLVIFASLNKGAHISSLGGIPYDDLLRPGHPGLRRHRRHVREHGDQHRDPPRPGSAEAHARHAATSLGVRRGADRLDRGDRAPHDGDHAGPRSDRLRRAHPAVDAPRADRHAWCSAPRRSRRSGSGSRGSSRTPRRPRSWSTSRSCR